MNITGLSLDSQLAILSQLSSHTLFSTVPLVCTRWNQLQPHACRRRRTVQLTIQSNSQQPGKSWISHFELRPSPLNTSYAAALFASFPCVTHLMLAHRDLGFEALDPQLDLLQSWTPTLVSINLFTNADHQAAQQGQLSPQFGAFFARFLALLNQMPRLKRLKLIIAGQLPPSADLTFLGRLADVHLIIPNSEHIIIPQLLQHCSPTLQRLSLGFINNFSEFLPLLTSSTICSKLERFKVSHFDLTQLTITFDRCSRLQSFSLFLTNLVEYAERIPLLNKLPLLTELLLQINLVSIAPFDPVIASTPLPALPSIRRLYFLLKAIPSHEHFVQATQLDRVFPQLQQLYLEWRADTVSCQQCKDNNRDSDSCIDAILRPLAHHETLQEVNVRLVTNGTQRDYEWLSRFHNRPLIYAISI